MPPRTVTRWASPKLSSTDRWPSPVEGAALEMPYSRKAVLGSNPNLSATYASVSASTELGERSTRKSTHRQRAIRSRRDARVRHADEQAVLDHTGRRFEG